MKKKLIQILMLSVIAVSVGSFVSCKDTNEDLYNELNTQMTQKFAENANMWDAYNAWKTTVQSQLGLYEGMLDDIYSKIGEDGLDGKIDQLADDINGQLATLTGLINQLNTDLATKADKTEIARLEGLINGLTTQLNGYKTLLDALLSNDIINTVATHETAISTLRTDVDRLKTLLEGLDDTNNFSEVLRRLGELETTVPQIQGQLTEALDKITTAQTTADNAQRAADAAKGIADQALQLAQRLDGDYTTLKDKLDTYANEAKVLAEKVDGINTRLTTLEKTVGEHTTELKNISDKVSELDKNYSLLSKDVKDAMNKAIDAYNKAEQNEKDIQNLKKDIESLQKKDKDLDGEISKLDKTTKDLNTAISDLKKELEGKINGNSTEITKLWAAIDALKLAGEGTQTTIAELSDRICCLETQVGLLEGSLAVATAASITHYEMAKKYALEQINLLEIRLKDYIQTYVAGQLAEFLANHPDVDLSRYVTRDEMNTRLQNYATQSQLNTLALDVNTRLGQLGTDLLNVQAALQTAINNLTNDVLQHGISINDLKNQLTTLDTKINNLDTKVNGIDSRVTANTTDIAWLKSLVATLNGQVSDLNANAGKYISRDEFNEWLKLMEEAIKNAGNHNNEGNTYDVDLALPSIVVQVIVKKIEDTLDDKVSEKLAELLKDKEFLDAFGKSLVEELGLLTEDDLKGFITEDDVKALIAPLKTLAEANEGKIKDHEDRIKKLEDDFKDLADKIVTDKIIDELSKTFATKDDIKDFLTEDMVKNLLKEYAPLADFNDLKDSYGAFKTDVLDYIDKNDAKVKSIGDAVNDINEKLPEMKKDISDLKDAVKENKDLIDKLNTEVEKIKGDVKAIQEELAKQVTSIIIQGTYSPMFGSFNLPANIQSNILLSYYGIPMADGQFPTYKTGSYTKAEQAFTSEEINTLKSQGLTPFEFYASEPLLNENGNGGKVYMTINPNTANLDGLQMSIVNSLDEEAPVRLRPIKKSEDKLQFGFTRANNGFYEAEAYVEPDDVMTKDNGVPLTRDEIENAFKSIRDRLKAVEKDYADKGGTDLGQLATDVYQVIRGLKMDRHGLKCTYTSNGTEHSVYSEYNMAATFFNPLNLNTAKDFDYKTMLGYETLDKILDDMAKTLKDHVDVLFKDALNVPALQSLIGNFVLDELEFKSMTENYIAHFNARVSKVNLNGADYRLKIPGSGTFAVMYDKNLTAGGSPVTIPDAVKYDEDKVNATRATLVIGGDVLTGMTAKMIVPASGADGVVNAYVSVSVYEESAKVTLNGGVIKVTTASDGTYDVAAFSGSNIDVTGYSPTVHLRDVVAGDGVLNLPVVLEISQDVQKLLAKQETTMDKVVTALNDYLNNINKYNGTVNGWVDSFIDDYLRKYLDEMNANVVGFFNAINRRFGPFMAASNDSKGFKRLSGSKEYPTIMSKDNLKFYPTTKSLELLVPLARKHVAVTNVFKGTATAYDNADCLAKMKAVNNGADFNKVIDGTVRKVNVTGMEAGYVYEVAYSVLDFDGNMSTSRYYIQVK